MCMASNERLIFAIIAVVFVFIMSIVVGVDSSTKTHASVYTQCLKTVAETHESVLNCKGIGY